MVGVNKNKISVISNSVQWSLGRLTSGDTLFALIFFFSLTLVLRQVKAEYRLAEDMRHIDHLKGVRMLLEYIKMSFGLDK